MSGARPDITAHRGGGGEAPENSLAAFRRSVGLGVERVEFDVHLSADGHPVVIHDRTLERTTTGSGAVADHTRAALAALRLIGADEGVPSLEAVLDTLAPSPLAIILEIKTPTPETAYDGIEALCLAALDRRGLIPRTTVISFSWDVLTRCRALSADVGIGGAAGWPAASPPGSVGAECGRLARIGGRQIGIHKDHDDPEGIAAARAMGIEIGIWPVNEPDELAFWLTQDVGVVSTDHPARALAIRNRIENGAP